MGRATTLVGDLLDDLLDDLLTHCAGILRTIGIIVVMGHSHYGPVVMVHMLVIMVHLGKSLWSTWVSCFGPPKKSLWCTIRNIRNNVEMGSKL